MYHTCLVHIHPYNCSGKNICNLVTRKFLTIGGYFNWFEPRCCLEEFLNTTAGIVLENN